MVVCKAEPHDFVTVVQIISQIVRVIIFTDPGTTVNSDIMCSVSGQFMNRTPHGSKNYHLGSLHSVIRNPSILQWSVEFILLLKGPMTRKCSRI